MRAFSEAFAPPFRERMERIVAGLCEAMRLQYGFEYRFGYPPTVNDPAAPTTSCARPAARSSARRTSWTRTRSSCGPKTCPSCWSSGPARTFSSASRGASAGGQPEHSAHFDIDERALEIGYEMMVALGLRLARGRTAGSA